MSDEETKKDPENVAPEPEVVEFEFNEDPEGKQASYGAGGEEDFPPEADQPRAEKIFKKLKADIKQLQKEKEEYLTGWQKERADFANYKKVEDDRKAMFSESMRERILTRFLAVMDSFNMAFANKEAWEKVDENWRR